MKKEPITIELQPIENFKMPRYSEIPNVGLYLKQVVRFINDIFEPYFAVKVTETMLSNYVKMHLISNPIKKQYNREQIANFLFLTLAKTVISLDNIQILLQMQKESYSPEVAYNYFCDEFENVLFHIYGHKDQMDMIGSEENETKKLLRRLIITIAHKFYLENSFILLKKSEE